KSIRERLAVIENELTQPKAQDRADTLDFPIKLNTKLAWLTFTVSSADMPPTQQAQAVFIELSARLKAVMHDMGRLLDGDVAAFNAEVGKMELLPVAPLPKEAQEAKEPVAARAQRRRG